MATVGVVLTVDFSHGRYPSGNRTYSIGMGPAATVPLAKGKLL